MLSVQNIKLIRSIIVRCLNHELGGLCSVLCDHGIMRMVTMLVRVVSAAIPSIESQIETESEFPGVNAMDVLNDELAISEWFNLPNSNLLLILMHHHLDRDYL